MIQPEGTRKNEYMCLCSFFPPCSNTLWFTRASVKTIITHSKLQHCRIGFSLYVADNLNLISTYVPSRSLRSASLSLLHVPRSNQKTYGDRAFAVAAPRLWNALPIQMRQPGTTLDTFKRSLKTLLFRQAFYRFLIS